MINDDINQNALPQWLIKTEAYAPSRDSAPFIQKSIITLLRILSRIHAQNAKAHIIQANPVIKMLYTFLFVLLLSMTGSLSFVAIAVVYQLAVLSLMRTEVLLGVVKVSLGVALFTFIVLLPTIFYGNFYSMQMILPKVFAAVVAVNLLSHTTRWNELTASVKYFHVPDLFIFVLDITIKYILLLGEFSLHMLYAVQLRSVGKNRNKVLSFSGIGGTLFLKSREMAEDMVAAMTCRGFSGEYRVYTKYRFRKMDALYVLIMALFVLLFIYT